MDGDTHPLRRKISATDWAIKGELFLNCNCTLFCPCVVSLGAHPPTEGYCHQDSPSLGSPVATGRIRISPRSYTTP